MKRLITIAAAALLLTSALAQETLPREESLKYAFFLAANLKEMLNTPIPTDPDVKRPVAVRHEDYGAMALPESRLSSDTFAKLGASVAAVGQIWLHKLAPLNGEKLVPAAKLRNVHLTGGDHEVDVVCCALGAQKTDKGLQLLIYGKDAEPVLQVPLKAISAQQENPLEISAERDDNGGVITLRFAGKYEATFKVTDPEQYSGT